VPGIPSRMFPIIVVLESAAQAEVGSVTPAGPEIACGNNALATAGLQANTVHLQVSSLYPYQNHARVRVCVIFVVTERWNGLMRNSFSCFSRLRMLRWNTMRQAPAQSPRQLPPEQDYARARSGQSGP
jgi:hypothetical protein